jgi:uncharacterized protein (DUF488 family)
MDTITYTIGYEGRQLADFIKLLVRERITHLVDIRELPLSRRKGFSKTPLREALGAANIEYIHLREAGNPYRHLKENVDHCLQLYRQHLTEHPEVVGLVAKALEGRRAALLCFEAGARSCHRSIITDRLRRRYPEHEIRHL